MHGLITLVPFHGQGAILGGQNGQNGMHGNASTTAQSMCVRCRCNAHRVAAVSPAVSLPHTRAASTKTQKTRRDVIVLHIASALRSLNSARKMDMVSALSQLLQVLRAGTQSA
jgi:hypothetical protein